MPRKPTVFLASCAAVLVAVVAACTGTSDTHPNSGVPGPTSSAQRSAVSLGENGCKPSSPIAETKLGPEVRGTGHGATLYGLLMSAKPLPIRTLESVKVVWRMTGSGPLRLTVTNPQGRPAALQWGPERHGGSNYNRPGQEWGAGYRFSTAGCWHLQARRSSESADVWLRVKSA
jgi:hypothetical protein